MNIHEVAGLTISTFVLGGLLAFYIGLLKPDERVFLGVAVVCIIGLVGISYLIAGLAAVLFS